MENTYFTCIGRSHGAPAVPATREDWNKMRREPWLADMCARIEKGDDELKHRLPVWTPSCAEFKNNHRSAADALKPLNRLMMDFDEKGHTDEICEKLKVESGKLKVVGIVPLMIEESARRGTHVLVELPEGMDAETAQQIMKEVTGFEPDKQVKGVDRCIYMVPEDHTKFVSERLFEPTPLVIPSVVEGSPSAAEEISPCAVLSRDDTPTKFPTSFKGIPYAEIIAEYWRSTGGEPNTGERNKRLHKLAANLRAICDDSEEWLLEIMPRYGLSLQEMKSIIHSACKEPTKGSRAMDQIVDELSSVMSSVVETSHEISPQGRDDKPYAMLGRDDKPYAMLGRDDNTTLGLTGGELCTKRLPQGVRDSINAVGPQLAMPIVTAICPCIGALATGVKLDVHGHMRGLNLISYIAGDFASGKGSIDPVVDTWMSEIAALDAVYLQQEEEYNKKKLAAKNKKEQPEDPKLPVRYITFNTTVAKLAERLGNTEGKHAFSFTPEADTVAQKWRSSMCDFSVMLRQSYDGSKYDREARSAEAVNVHIKHLLWNVTMCGTPDALYRVVTNYTDGFQSRIALAQTPDNTYAPLEDKPYVLTDRQAERIKQIAHLLPLMYGEVVLPKLEARGREWLEKIRLDAMKNDDRVKARERFRTCVTAQRMVCCLMLCRVCEQLIQKHGYAGAETQLKLKPNLWKEMLLKTQTPAMLDTYDVIADSLIDNALYFFRDRIENAFRSREYAAVNERKRFGRNDSIYERLDVEFSFEMAMQHSMSMNGAGVTRNKVHQMLKNWKHQGLIVPIAPNRYRKLSH